MMNYVVMQYDELYDKEFLAGIFSSKEKAEVFMDVCRTIDDYFDYYIEEYECDAKLRDLYNNIPQQLEDKHKIEELLKRIDNLSS